MTCSVLANALLIVFFTPGKLIKRCLADAGMGAAADAGRCACAGAGLPFGVLAGLFLHRQLEQRPLFFWFYLLLFAPASRWRLTRSA